MLSMGHSKNKKIKIDLIDVIFRSSNNLVVLTHGRWWVSGGGKKGMRTCVDEEVRGSLPKDIAI